MFFFLLQIFHLQAKPMDFTRSQFSSLFNSVTLEKSKFISVLHKIKTLLQMTTSPKLILTPHDKLVLTDSPLLIFQNVNFKHPIMKILLEYFEKMEKMGSADRLFIDVALSLLDSVSHLLENNIKSKKISDALMDISDLFQAPDSLDIGSLSLSSFTEDTKKYLRNIIKEDAVADLLINCVEKVGSFDTERIRILKIQSGSFEDSYTINGMVLETTPLGSVKSLKNTTMGIFSCPLDIARTELKGNLLFKNSDELLNYSKDEISLIQEVVSSINVNAIVVMGNINEMFLDYLDERNILCLRIFNNFDLKRLRNSVDGCIEDHLGYVEKKGSVMEIEMVNDGGRPLTKIVSAKDNVCTLVLKNSVSELLDEMERRVLSVLSVFGSKTNRSISSSCFSDAVSQLSGSSVGSVFKDAFTDALSLVSDIEMFDCDKIRAMRYSFEFVAKILEIDDYLLSKADQLNIKPKDNPNWGN